MAILRVAISVNAVAGAGGAWAYMTNLSTGMAGETPRPSTAGALYSLALRNLLSEFVEGGNVLIVEYDPQLWADAEREGDFGSFEMYAQLRELVGTGQLRLVAGNPSSPSAEMRRAREHVQHRIHALTRRATQESR